MLVTEFPIVTLLTDERLLYHGADEELDQFVIAPVPEMVSFPVLVSSVHVRLSPQVPEYVAASAFIVKRSRRDGKSTSANAPIGDAPNSIISASIAESVRFANFFILIPPFFKIRLSVLYFTLYIYRYEVYGGGSLFIKIFANFAKKDLPQPRQIFNYSVSELNNLFFSAVGYGDI